MRFPSGKVRSMERSLPDVVLGSAAAGRLRSGRQFEALQSATIANGMHGQGWPTFRRAVSYSPQPVLASSKRFASRFLRTRAGSQIRPFIAM